MRTLGWAEYLKVEMTNHRKTLTVSYWVYVNSLHFRPLLKRPSRPPLKQVLGQPPPPPSMQRNAKLPSFGGKIIISITEPSIPTRSATQRVLDDLEHRSKLSPGKPSDKVENLKITVEWEPSRGTLGVDAPLINVMDEGVLTTVCAFFFLVWIRIHAGYRTRGTWTWKLYFITLLRGTLGRY